MRERRIGSLWWLIALWALGACTQTETVAASTQIMLRISTRDAALQAQIEQLQVSVSLREGSGWKAPATKIFPADVLRWPVDVPIVPRVPGDSFKQFQVVVEAHGPDGVLAQARAISSFVRADRKVLPLSLFLCPHHAPGFVCDHASCAGTECQVCSSDGACAPVPEINPDDLSPLDDVDPEDAAVDPDGPTDAGGSNQDAGGRPRPDAGADAQAPRDADGDEGTSEPSDAGAEPSEAALPDTGGPEDAGDSSFVPVRFSASDHDPVGVVLSPDRLSVESRGEDIGNARSDRAIAPGSGVFYFEASRLIDPVGMYGIGVATASASLTAPIGGDRESLGLYTAGDFANTGASCSGSASEVDVNQRHYGFVIDYRAQNPRVHIVLAGPAGAARVVRSCSSTLTAPLHVFYSGSRYQVGYQLSINTGSDTTNFPFHFAPETVKAALNAVGEGAAASALVAGFGQTRARAPDAPPSLSVPGDRSVAAGTAVMLTATAADAEDGTLTAQIVWNDLAALHHAPLTAVGGSFSFTPGLGRHPVRVSVTDSAGHTVSKVVMINATGALPSASGPVRLAADELSDAEQINLSGDGLSADFRGFTPGGIRANQPIYGQYWYFEAHRVAASGVNIAAGLVVREGDLDPVDVRDPPWCATVYMLGFTTYNLNSSAYFDASHGHYGFAVDYRQENPRVHLIVGGGSEAPTGKYVQTIEMKDVWTPLWPMVYGAWLDDNHGPDVTLNFGATPFMFSPLDLLGPDRAAGIRLGWGVHAP